MCSNQFTIPFFFNKKINKQIIKLNDQNLNELVNQSISLRLRAAQDTFANWQVRRSAEVLINFLNKEYHLR